MLTLTSRSGGQVVVNPFHIFTMRADTGGGTIIMSGQGAEIAVSDDLESVTRSVKVWTRG